jgi:hypothetical protein
MGAILASSLISTARKALLDTDGVRWGTSDLLGYLNDGQREVLILKPDAYTITTSILLSAGTKQDVPANCVQLHKLVRNMGLDGNTPGNSITIVDMQHLDKVKPSWHSVTASPTVIHYMFDVKNPKTFWTYPKNTGTGYVEAILAAVPPDVPSSTSAITLDDIYSNALVNYMLHKAYAMDADFAANEKLAVLYYQNFANALMGKDMRENAEDPNISK